MRSLSLVLALFFLCPSLPAQDWATLKMPGMAEAGKGRWGVSVDYGVSQSWAMSEGRVRMTDSDGFQKIQQRIDLGFDLAWQLNETWSVGAAIPYRFAEFSLYPPEGFFYNFRLNDATLRRVEGAGDLKLEFRAALGPRAGLGLELTAPTGLGPFEASHPMVALGEGRWQAEPRFVLGAEGRAHEAWLQVGAPIQGGREAVLSSQAPLDFEGGAPRPAANGSAYLGPRYGVHAVLGGKWIWFNEEHGRHALALELDAWERGAWNLDGQDLPGSQQHSVSLVPQMQSDFGRFKALAAWRAPAFFRQNVPVADYGVTHMKVTYGF